jgi:integrase
MRKNEGDSARQRQFADYETRVQHGAGGISGRFQEVPRPGFTKATVSAWRVSLEARRLGSSSIIIRMSSIRKLAAEAADNGLLAPELAAGIGRVKSAKSVGIRMGNWLSVKTNHRLKGDGLDGSAESRPGYGPKPRKQEGLLKAHRLKAVGLDLEMTLKQPQSLLNTPYTTTLRGLRDRAILAVLLVCGLRRSEVAALTFKHVQQRDGHWCIVDLVGKHRRVRTVPMPNCVKVAIDTWTVPAGVSDGHVFRSVQRGDKVQGTVLSEKVVWQMLRPYAAAAQVPGIAPHGRRTAAKLCLDAGGELGQIQMLLGHASVQTTERCLGTKQDLVHAPNDAMKLRVVI